jgi:hypothetical protein
MTMTKPIRIWTVAVAAVVALAVAAPALAADAGFAGFWKVFTAAVAKDDKPALAKMVVLSEMGDWSSSFAAFHAGGLKPAARRCLLKAKPDRDGEGNYNVNCGDLIYGFSKAGGVWKLAYVSPDD